MRSPLVPTLAFVALLAALPAMAVGADPSSPQPFFFRVSPLEATPQPAEGATRYSVALANAPVGNTPFIRWYLELKSGTTDALCSNDVLPGGTRVAPGKYVWKNQGLSFIWYHGPEGSYASRRSYGCDQGALGLNGYPGTVTVVFENDSETCTASFAGLPRSPAPQAGPDAQCQLGGYLPLPVPRALLRSYAGASASLNALLRRAQAGTIHGRQIADGVRSVLKSEAAAFRLFPPVWGCRFEDLFQAVLDARAALGEQLAGTAAAQQSSPPGALRVGESVKALEATLQSCRPTTGRPVGVPADVSRAVGQLTTEAGAIRNLHAGGAAALRDLDVGLERLIATRFPSVLGIKYVDLVDQVLAERSAAALATQATQSGDIPAATAALAQLRQHQGTIASGLRKQAARSAKAEKAA